MNEAFQSVSLAIWTRVVILLALTQISVGCDSRNPEGQSSKLPFTFTNLVTDAAKPPSWVVMFTNSLSWTVEEKRMSMNFGLQGGVTIDLDPNAESVRKIVVELPASKDEPGQWIADVNGDGVPDTRKLKGSEGLQVFYRGDWLASEMEGTNRFVRLGGQKSKVIFLQRRWQILK